MKFIDKFPGIDGEENTLITFDREMALQREDIIFATGDHPIGGRSTQSTIRQNEGLLQWQNGLILHTVKVFLSSYLSYSNLQGQESWNSVGFFALSVKNCSLPTRENLSLSKDIKNLTRLTPLGFDDQRPDPEILKQIIEPIVESAQKSIQTWSEEQKKKQPLLRRKNILKQKSLG